ncbi:MAG TPA: universal stress protein [Gemmatimonadaceae bacterium]
MFKKILVPLDRSALAEQAIGQAMRIARGAKAAIELVLVYQPHPIDAPWEKEDETANSQYLDGIARDLQSRSALPVVYVVLRGSPAECICERDADLIVMTSHGRTGFNRAWLGSVADAVVRHTSVPVLMLRPTKGSTSRGKAGRAFKHILVLVDGSEFAAEVLGPAIDLAKAIGANLTLFRAVYPIPLITRVDEWIPSMYAPIPADEKATAEAAAQAKADLESLAQQIRDAHALAVSADVTVNERFADGIVQFAKSHNIDCIAMTTHGRGASRLVLGSVADKVLRGSGLPVLIRRPAAVAETDLGAEEVAEQLQTTMGGL